MRACSIAIRLLSSSAGSSSSLSSPSLGRLALARRLSSACKCAAAEAKRGESGVTAGANVCDLAHRLRPWLTNLLGILASSHSILALTNLLRILAPSYSIPWLTDLLHGPRLESVDDACLVRDPLPQLDQLPVLLVHQLLQLQQALLGLGTVDLGTAQRGYEWCRGRGYGRGCKHGGGEGRGGSPSE